MDTQPPVPQVVQCQCPYCRRRWWSPIRAFFRFLGLLILLLVVFLAGLLIGGREPFADVASLGRVGLAPFGPGVGYAGRSGDCWFGRDDADKYFGVITAVSGQTVTIADNGGGTQAVLITSDTTVMDGEREVPMWKLRTGNAVRVFGDTEGSAVTAELIEVVR